MNADKSGEIEMTARAVGTSSLIDARVAGFTFLFYIAVGIVQMVLLEGATSTEGTAAKLTGMAQQATSVRISVVLGLLTCFAALVLAVTLYRITRDQGPGLALLALTCRVGEGVIGAIPPLATVGLLWLATAGAGAPDAAAASALAAFLLKVGGWSTTVGATFFAVGSTLFSYLLLRGRMIPVGLAWLGVIASVLLVVALPLQLIEFLGSPISLVLWLPMAVFEVVLALWLLIKGVALPAARNVALTSAK